MSGDLKADLGAALRGATKEWKKAKKREDQVKGARLKRMREYRPPRYTIRDAAFEAMQAAYEHASSNGKFYANARQIMYAARPMVLDATGGECWKNSAYFTQTLLKDYIEDFAPDWKIVWDARGHMHEPHTGHSVDLGGVAVMDYIKAWKSEKFEELPVSSISERINTKGPRLRFAAALFIEKEGFAPILTAAGIAERYDLAIMSTKGVPVGAACDLARSLHGQGVEIMVAHDFDLAGFKIAKTMREGTRLTTGAPVIDIGLRLEDVDGLASEPVDYHQKRDPRHYLAECGVTDEEAAVLVSGGDHRRGWWGDRIELNAMTSERLIDWLELKFVEHGIKKVVPGSLALASAYRRALFRIEQEKLSGKLAKEMPKAEVPDDLGDRVRAYIEDHPTESWDEAVAAIADELEDGR